MKTVGEPWVLRALIARLNGLRPDRPRRWGTLTPHEMLCHLGDAAEMVLLTRPRTEAVPDRSRPIIKWLALSSPLRWPHGWATNPMTIPAHRAPAHRPSRLISQERWRDSMVLRPASARSSRLSRG